MSVYNENQKAWEVDYISVKDATEKWNISVRWMQKLCEEGRVAGTMRFRYIRMIPKDAEK